MTNAGGDSSRILTRVRWAIGGFILGLVISGLTAFPLEHEVDLMTRWTDARGWTATTPLGAWIAGVRDGLHTTNAAYPFLAYGTDWLAFGHLVIAAFFVGPWRDPVRHVFILRVGLWACAGVVPLALICGEVRGVPLLWRLIDCSFGVVGALPLLYALRGVRQLAAASQRPVG